MMWNSVDNALINACVIINPAQVGEVPWHRFGWEVGVLGRMEELRRKEKNCELWRIAKNCELCGRRIGVVTLVAPLSDCWEGTLCDNCWTLCDSVTHCHTHHWPQTLNVLLIREGVRKKTRKKCGLLPNATPTPSPQVKSFLQEKIVKSLYLVLLYQFIFAHNRPKSDIGRALGPIHYITLKAFAMALGDRTM